MAQDGFVRFKRSDIGAAQERLDAAGRPQGSAQRASRASAQRIAIDAADVSGGRMVTAVFSDAGLRQRAWDTAAKVVDPEIPVLTIADLGVLRDVVVNDGRVEVVITPTYSGCPAMNMITVEIELALEREGFRNSKVRTVLSPAWTTDWMSEDGRRSSKRTASRRRRPPAPAARCSACSRWHARNAAPRIPKCYRNSVRPPARRCGAARAAASRSTISNVIEHVVIDTALSSPCRQRSAPRISGRGVADLCDSASACGRLPVCPRTVSDLAHDDGRRGSAPLLFDLLRPR